MQSPGGWQTSKRMFREAAEEGDLYLMFGYHYYKVTKDPMETVEDAMESFYWVSRMCEEYPDEWPDDPDNKKRAHMFHHYGHMLTTGKNNYVGTLIDLDESVVDVQKGFKYYEKSALLGSGQAAMSLATHYVGHNEAIPRNIEKPFYWMGKAAQLGESKAALQMAGYYTTTPNVNPRLYMKWLKAAARLGSRKAKDLLVYHEEGTFDKFGQAIVSIQNKCMHCGVKIKDMSFHECARCHLVRYCSQDCMAKNSALHGIHCGGFAKTFSAGFKPDDITAATIHCFGPECNECDVDGERFKRCSRCKHTLYYSPACQKRH